MNIRVNSFFSAVLQSIILLFIRSGLKMQLFVTWTASQLQEVMLLEVHEGTMKLLIARAHSVFFALPQSQCWLIIWKDCNICIWFAFIIVGREEAGAANEHAFVSCLTINYPRIIIICYAAYASCQVPFFLLYFS